MKYVYETHLHTIEASACSSTPGEDYIDYMAGLGYSGIIVTDHFFTGNSCVPRSLPWEEKVRIYCIGYKNALKKAGDSFTVMFGVEYNFQGDEFLLYGVDEEWLLAHPEIMERDRYKVCRMVHDAGGIMIQAHPFRERGYLSEIHITPGVSDGVECYNAANPDYQNALAYMYAKERGFKMTGGSDIHYFGQPYMGGMAFDHPIGTIQEFVEAFLDGQGVPVYRKGIENGKADFLPVSENISLTETEQSPSLEVFWH